MIFTVKDTDKILVDARNRHIKNVYEFNDETMEAKMYLMNGKNELVVVQDKAGPRTVGIEICLPGARIMDKKEYEEKYVIKQETKEIDDGTEDLFLVFNEFELLRVTGQQLKDADISYEQGKAMFKLLGGAIETALNIPLDELMDKVTKFSAAMALNALGNSDSPVEALDKLLNGDKDGE